MLILMGDEVHKVISDKQAGVTYVSSYKQNMHWKFSIVKNGILN